MRPKYNPTIEDCIEAIIARDRGMPYPEVLKTFELTPNKFARTISMELGSYIALTSGERRKILEGIISDPERRRELFNMGEEFVKEQYDRIQGRIHREKQSHFYHGTHFHPKNVDALVYYALTSNNPSLSSNCRNVVIEGIKNLPLDLAKYFMKIGLRGLMSNEIACRGKADSPLAILKIFDKVYRQKTGDASLFDLSQKEHLHRWGDNFMAPLSYWHDKTNIREAVYHILTENNTGLSSSDRTKVIQTINNFPTNLADYFHGIHMRGLMANFEKGRQNSPLEVLEVFDEVYRQKTGDASLFDLSQKEHLHRWGDNFMAPNNYWQNIQNVEEAVYHLLTENNPILASPNRSELIKGINGLPSNLQDYLHKMGFAGLMAHAFEKGRQSSPMAVLQILDKIYQEKTGDKSLFDSTQNIYLKIDGRNKIIRE